MLSKLTEEERTTLAKAMAPLARLADQAPS
jgi:hypothetical protein